MRIDLNADAGEGFGRYRAADEEALFPHLTSVNLACGFHAGDPLTMRASIALAARHGVAVGAHPGFPDRVGFGRRDLAATPDEIRADTLYQLGALSSFLRAAGLALHHVKPHGALYHRVHRDEAAAAALAAAVAEHEPSVPLVTLAGPAGRLARRAAEASGLRTVAEAFPDRAYLASGELAPRGRAGSVLAEPERIAERAVRLARGEAVAALDGGEVRVEADTLCLHGDEPAAARTAAAVRRALADAGVEVRAF